MIRRYAVAPASCELPSLAGQRVVFHGINKSGSLALTEVLLEAYRHHGREREFYSHYHGRPRALTELVRLVNETRAGHAFFVGHRLYRAYDPALPGCALVTLFRHPLTRTLSCYAWLKAKNPGAPFPTLAQWVEQTRGYLHSQAYQLAAGYPAERPRGRRYKDPEALLDRALKNVKRHVAWYGLAEHFEESIFVLAHLCGLESVVPWRRDDRNVGRPRASTLASGEEELIRHVFRADFELYRRLRLAFLRRVEAMGYGTELAAYREACAAEYKDRLTS
jgi:hypothetical protein